MENKIEIAINNLNEIIKAVDTLKVEGYNQSKLLVNIVDGLYITIDVLKKEENKG